MKDASTVYISGSKTTADWFATRQALTVGRANGWSAAFTDFFQERLMLRYMKPIAVLQKSGESKGEGFSIVAIQCSLIEFIESTIQGVNYKYTRPGQQLGAYEYSASKSIFISFLSERSPFSATFDTNSAEDFYASVRCGLLHEARTKNGWRIRATDFSGVVADTTAKIVYRNNFQKGLLSYLKEFESKLPHDTALQEAFIRKMDYLCQ